MPIIVEWENDEKTIIRIVFPAKWTWEEFSTIGYDLCNLMDHVNHAVCCLMDMGATRHLPPDLKLETVRTIFDCRHENADMLVIYSREKMVRVLLHIVQLAIGKVSTPIEIVDNREEAYDRIQYRLREIQRSGG